MNKSNHHRSPGFCLLLFRSNLWITQLCTVCGPDSSCQLQVHGRTDLCTCFRQGTPEDW